MPMLTQESPTAAPASPATNPDSAPSGVGLIGRRIAQAATLPQWLLFKAKAGRYSATRPESVAEADQDYSIKEGHLRTLLSATPGARFLEIGIGAAPNLDRLRLMAKNGVHYTACDFDFVCERHERETRAAGIDTSRFSYSTNSTGTYAWQLMEMLQRNERYDIVYVDGHHTFYVDLPAIIQAHYLLKPGGHLLLDDIKWTLEFMRHTLANSFGGWYFYHKMYNFDEYTPKQQGVAHIQMIAEELLIKRERYEKVAEHSTDQWWTLRKPLN